MVTTRLCNTEIGLQDKISGVLFSSFAVRQPRKQFYQANILGQSDAPVFNTAFDESA